MTETIDLLTSSQLARKLDKPNIAVAELIKAKVLVPDYRSGRYSLFRPDRVEEVRALLEKGVAHAS